MRQAVILFLFAAGAMVPRALAQNPLTDAFLARYRPARQNLIGAAEAMPAESYEFKLTAAQRPFSGWIRHTAIGNYHFCAPFSATKAPDTHVLEDATAKADLVKAIQDSFAFCDAALEGMTDQKALTAASVDGKSFYPVQSMISMVASTNEHYGNLVGYLRSKGITPPSSQKK